MASVSLSVVRGGDYTPDGITQGTDAPNTGDLEVSINLVPANSATKWTKQEVINALTRIIELVEDGRYTALLSV